jgi:hypothetical protein
MGIGYVSVTVFQMLLLPLMLKSLKCSCVGTIDCNKLKLNSFLGKFVQEKNNIYSTKENNNNNNNNIIMASAKLRNSCQNMLKIRNFTSSFWNMYFH